jgi:hypothetical protein
VIAVRLVSAGVSSIAIFLMTIIAAPPVDRLGNGEIEEVNYAA